MSETALSQTAELTTVRDRLLVAMQKCLRAGRYSEITVADIVREARTSRRAFYQEFTDKQDCLMALLTWANSEMVDAIAAGVDPLAPWQTQIRQAVEAYVASIEEHPEITRAWVRDLPALGDSTSTMHRAAAEKVITLLIALTDTPTMRDNGIRPLARPTAVLIWGGIRELSAQAVEDGRAIGSVAEQMIASCIALVGANVAC